MKKYLSISVFLLAFSLIVGSVGAVTYPSTTPSGETGSGKFNDYFMNMYSAPCASGLVIEGFTTTGVLLCVVQNAATTSGFTGSLIGIDRYIPRYTTAGTGITISQIYDSGSSVIIGYGTGTLPSVNNTRLTLSGGDLNIDGIRLGRGKTNLPGNTIVGEGAFTSHIGGTLNTIFGYNAGSTLVNGNNNIAIGNNAQVYDTAGSDQMNIGNIIYGSDLTGGGSGSVGIGTNTPRTKLEIDSGISDVAGLRFTRLNLTSAVSTGGTQSIGINASGEVVPIIPLSNIAVFDGLTPGSSLLTTSNGNPDEVNHNISYDFNKFFKISGKQSFVISDGSVTSLNGPYFQENGLVSHCSGIGSPYLCPNPDPVRNEGASPANSFTMSAKGSAFGYQIALAARGDAPLFARSGKFDLPNYGSGLFLPGTTTPSPWQKVVTMPVNHPEYFYINTGYSSQLVAQPGGGEVGIGTSFPHSRFEIWTGASTASLMHFRGSHNVALGESALGATFYTGVTTAINYSNTVALGYGAGSGLTSGNNNILIGANATSSSISSDFLNIGNVLFGTSINGSLASPQGSIGIGISAPSQQLELTKSMQIPDTNLASTVGIIYKNGNRFLHNFINSSPLNDNTFLGINSGNFGMGFTAVGNTAVGRDSLSLLSSGNANTALGSYTLTSNAGGSQNTAVGFESLMSNTAGINNTAHGFASLRLNTLGNGNTAFGKDALRISTGNANTAFGSGAGNNITSGSNNTAIGANTNFLSATSSNQLNIANIIYGSGLTGNGSGNIGIGVANPTYKLQVAGTGSFAAIQISAGANTGYVLMSNGTTGIGTWAANPPSSTEWSKPGNSGTNPGTDFLGTTDAKDLVIKTAGQERLRVLQNGSLSLSGMTIGRGNNYQLGNTALGVSALSSIAANGINNTAIGSGVLKDTQTGKYNVGVGVSALNQLQNGNYNTAIGYNTLGTSQNGVNNIAIGSSALSTLGNGSNNIAIGSGVQVPNTNGNNQLNIGNMIYGVGNNIGIGSGVTVPTSTLTLSGTFRYTDGNQGLNKVLRSDASGNATWQSVAGALVWDQGGNTGAVATYIGTNDLNEFAMRTSGIERMRITPTGTVGIGTPTPFATYLLHVNGSTYLNNVDVASGANITFQQPITGSSGGLRWLLGNTDFASISALENSPDQTDLTFTVGDNSRGGSNATRDKFVFKIDEAGSANDVYPMTLAPLFANFYSGAMYIDSTNTGNIQVGFGTSNPTTRVDIDGDIRIRGSSPVFPGYVLVSTTAGGLAQWQPLSSASGMLNSWSINGNTGASSEYIGTNDTRDFIIKTNLVERLRVLQDGNILLGSGANSSITIGRGNGQVSGNTAFGVKSLDVTTGGNNTAMGSGSLRNNLGGTNNTAIGFSSLISNTSGGNNTAHGLFSLFSNISGGNNVANGVSALYYNVGGSSNNAIGYRSLYNTTGSNNTALGDNAGSGITSGSNNIAIGYGSAVPSATANNQLSIGNWIYGSGGNIGIGVSNPGAKLEIAGQIKITGGSPGINKVLTSDASGLAVWSGAAAPTTEWTRVGNNISSSPTDFLGTTSNNDLIIKTNGVERLRVLTGGSLSLSGMTIGRGNNYIAGNTALGVSALSVTTGGNNTAIGSGALKSNLGGTNNTANGLNSLFSNTTGNYNVANGVSALFGNATGNNNIALGYQSLYNATASNNTALGYMAGSGILAGANNTLLGSLAGSTITSGSNNIAIGYNAQVPTATSNNQLSIGNWIYGSGGNIGIGTSNPTSLLSLSGSFQFTDGNQSTGAYLRGNPDGTAYWYSAKNNKLTYVKRVGLATLPATNLVYHTELSSDDLPIGPYEFEFIGKFQTSNLSDGIGLTISSLSGSINEFIASASIQQTPTTKLDSYFDIPNTIIQTSSSPSTSSSFPGIIKGTFYVTSTGSVAVGIKSSNANPIFINIGSTLIIRTLDPTIISSNI